MSYSLSDIVCPPAGARPLFWSRRLKGIYYATGLGQATRARDIVLSLRLGHGAFKRDEAAQRSAKVFAACTRVRPLRQRVPRELTCARLEVLIRPGRRVRRLDHHECMVERR